MVEVALKAYIFVHRRDGMNPTLLADSYMPALPACAVISIPQVDFGYLKKKRQGWVWLDPKRQGWV